MDRKKALIILGIITILIAWWILSPPLPPAEVRYYSVEDVKTMATAQYEADVRIVSLDVRNEGFENRLIDIIHWEAENLQYVPTSVTIPDNYSDTALFQMVAQDCFANAQGNVSHYFEEMNDNGIDSTWAIFFNRAELPLDILDNKDNTLVIILDQLSVLQGVTASQPLDLIPNVALGRCGEFSLLFEGLCLANNIPVHLIVDVSHQTKYDVAHDIAAGDHMWNEIYDEGDVLNMTNPISHTLWIPVEITQTCINTFIGEPNALIINQPLYYKDDWHKDINSVWSIASDGTCTDVTKDYQ